MRAKKMHIEQPEFVKFCWKKIASIKWAQIDFVFIRHEFIRILPAHASAGRRAAAFLLNAHKCQVDLAVPGGDWRKGILETPRMTTRQMRLQWCDLAAVAEQLRRQQRPLGWRHLQAQLL